MPKQLSQSEVIQMFNKWRQVHRVSLNTVTIGDLRKFYVYLLGLGYSNQEISGYIDIVIKHI